MTESAYTRQLVKALRQRLPQPSEVFKLSDRYTAGIPDLSVTVNGITTWFEAKKIKINPLINPMNIVEFRKAHIPGLQWETLLRLQRGYVIVYTDAGHAITRVDIPWNEIGTQFLTLVSMSRLLYLIIGACHD